MSNENQEKKNWSDFTNGELYNILSNADNKLPWELIQTIYKVLQSRGVEPARDFYRMDFDLDAKE